VSDGDEGQRDRRDHEQGSQRGQNPSDEVPRSGHAGVAWLLIIPLSIVLAAMPVTFVAVAVRPSQATIRAAGVMMVALLVVAILLVLVAAIA
jgi:hypothetical protein